MFSKIKKYLLQIFLFFLPIQTVYIVQENFLNAEKWQYATVVFYLTEMIAWLVIIFFVVDSIVLLKNKSIERQKGWSKEKMFSVAILFFLLYLIYSTFFIASNFEIAYQMTRWWMLGFLLFIILISGFLKIKEILWSVVLGSIFPSILGIWQFLFQHTFASKFLGLSVHAPEVSGVSVVASDQIGRWLRAYGTLGNPNIFAGYLVLTVIFTFLLMKKVDLKKQKMFLIIMLFVQTMALFFTFSRTAWLAWFVFVIFITIYCLIVNKRIAWPIVFSLAFFAVLFSLFFPLVQNRTELKSSYEIRSISERMDGYREALTIWDDHKYLGVGVGNYTLASFKLDSSKNGTSYQPVHNIFLLFIVENGIVGFTLFSFILATFFIYLVSIVEKKKLFFSIILSVFFLILGLFDHYLLSSYIGLIILSLYLAVSVRLSTE